MVNVVVDYGNTIAELNDLNNSLTQQLSCGVVKPPLTGDPPTTIQP